MSETQQPEPITAWAAVKDGKIEVSTLSEVENYAWIRAESWWQLSLQGLRACGVRIAKVEIREVTQ